MIVPMKKLFVVARTRDREHLLEALGQLGVMHLVPVQAERGVPEEQVARSLESVRRGLQRLEAVQPSGEVPDISAVEAAEEVVEIYRRSSELESRLNVLYRQVESLELWGDLRLDQIRRLEAEGMRIRFFRANPSQASEIRAECVGVIRTLADGRQILAAADRRGDIEYPEGVEVLELPERDRPSIREEAEEIDRQLRSDSRRLGELAHLVDQLRLEQRRLEEQAAFSAARNGALQNDALFAVQGWVPEKDADRVATGLARQELDAACSVLDPGDEEQPPTLIEYPRWASPIKGLFDILGTQPGYREFDVSAFFMVALPIFAAMLIGDAGYGLIFIAIPMLLWKKVAATGRETMQLMLIFGVTSLIWGAMIAAWFGVTPDWIAQVAGYTTEVEGQVQGNVGAMLQSGEGGLVTLGKAMTAVALLYPISENGTYQPEFGIDLIIMVSFIFGMLHLVSAQLRQALAVAPDQKFLSHIGWAVFLVGMAGLIWTMFFKPKGYWVPPESAFISLLIIGAALIVLFSFPKRNPFVRLGMGLMGNSLNMVGAFSDTMSYIRLMAVGMASGYIAYSTNLLASMVADSATWLAGAPVLLFGHGLNIVLVVIAIFAHGVRLNMLEFSNNAGVQWGGYAFSPFRKLTQ